MTDARPWDRARRGLHTVLVGTALPPPPADLRFVRVSCDVPAGTLGPLLDARDQVEAVLGATTPLASLARSGVTSLRRHLWGDPSRERSFAEVCNRLAEVGGWVLVLDAADAADAATRETLLHLLARPGALRLPLVLVLRGAASEPAVAELVAAVERSSGEGAVVRGAAPAAVPPTRPFDPHAFSPEVVRVLRAVSVAGSGCEARTLAAALDLRELDVLEALQLAADAGLPVDDRGEGRAHLPESLLDEVRATMLPSFAAALHRRLAEVLAAPVLSTAPVTEAHVEAAPRPADAWSVLAPQSPVDAPEAAAGDAAGPSPEPAPPPDPAPTPTVERAPVDGGEGPPAAPGAPAPAPLAEPEPAPAAAAAPEPAPAPEAPPGPAREPDPAPRAAWPVAEETFAPIAAEPFAPTSTARAAPNTPEPLPRPSPYGSPRERPRRADAGLRDEARAARHHEAAGDAELAIRRYAEAMQRASAAGAYAVAVAHADRALGLLDRLPRTEARRQQRAALMLETSRILWHGVGPGEAFTLTGALRVAEAARAGVTPNDAPDLVADLAGTVAGISYEIGTRDALARAEQVLADTTRALADAGHALAATRLFNDQASVLLRGGDPVRAAHLLMESRKVFEPRAASDATARAEMAETDHLLARVLLVAPPRPGREADALSLALDHAIAAERAFSQLSSPREAARVRETMGRVEVRRGREARALEHLRTALAQQESLGDVVGLARTTAALSDLSLASGDVSTAVQLLADSIALNAEKRAFGGLAFNREALVRLRAKAPHERAALAALEQRLAAAESSR